MNEQMQKRMDTAIQAYRDELHEVRWGVVHVSFMRAALSRERLIQLIELDAPEEIIGGEISLLNKFVLLMKERRMGQRLQ